MSLAKAVWRAGSGMGAAAVACVWIIGLLETAVVSW